MASLVWIPWLRFGVAECAAGHLVSRHAHRCSFSLVEHKWVPCFQIWLKSVPGAVGP